VKFAQMTNAAPGEPSAAIRARVIAARERQRARFAGRPITCNARMGTRELKQFVQLDEMTLQMLKNAMTELNLSARAYDRILKVSRTIADLAGSDTVTHEHVFEAVQYRSMDRNLWG
jgi:magnesium chelatase family protein